MMNPAETRKLKEWAPLPIIITVILLWAPDFIIAPQLDNLDELDKAFGATLKSVNESFRQRDDDARHRIRFRGIRKEMSRLQRWLPKEEFMPTLVDQCDRLAQLFGVKMSSVMYSFQDGKKKELPGFSLTFTLAGEYQAIRSFVQGLEGLPSPLFLTEIIANKNRTYTLSVMHLVKP